MICHATGSVGNVLILAVDIFSVIHQILTLPELSIEIHWILFIFHFWRQTSDLVFHLCYCVLSGLAKIWIIYCSHDCSHNYSHVLQASRTHQYSVLLEQERQQKIATDPTLQQVTIVSYIILVDRCLLICSIYCLVTIVTVWRHVI